MTVTITTTIWHERRKGYISPFRGKKWWWDRNTRESCSVAYILPGELWLVSVGWAYAHGGCVGLPWVCVHVDVCTVSPQWGQHVGSGKATIVLMCFPCQGSLASFRRMSAMGWRKRVLFPKQLEVWQIFNSPVNKGAPQYKLGWRAHPLLCPQGKTVTHPAWYHCSVCLWHVIKKVWVSLGLKYCCQWNVMKSAFDEILFRNLFHLHWLTS